MTGTGGPPPEQDPTVPLGGSDPTQAMPTPPGATPPGGPTGVPPDDGGGSSRRWWWIVGGVLAVMIIVIVAALLLRDGDGDDTPGDTTTTSSTTATTSPTTTAPTTTTTTAPAAGPQINSFGGPANAGCPDGDNTSTQQVQLSWSTTNTTGVTIGIDNPGPFDSYGPSGSATLPYTCPGPHTYHLVATGSDGSQATEVLNIPGS